MPLVVRKTKAVQTLEAPVVPNIGSGEVLLAKCPTTLHFEPTKWSPELVANIDRKKVFTADNVVRWNFDNSGDDCRTVSNARIVEWDNGDVHLFIGNEIYDITKHRIGQENLHLFNRLPNGMAKCEHKFFNAMVLRTNLQRKSRVNELLTRKIHSKFHENIIRRDLKIRLTDQPPRQPEQEDKGAEALQRKRTRQLAQHGIGETRAADDEEDAFEGQRVERLRTAQETVADEGVKRRRTLH